jgi:hypothetical protein
MYFISIYENRRMKPVDIVLRRDNDGGGKSKTYISTQVNITIYLPAQLSYANKVSK